MKTATVRELRYKFATLAKWVESGGHVTINRYGKAFAILSPATPEKPPEVDWAARFATRSPIGKGISKSAGEEIWSDLRD